MKNKKELGEYWKQEAKNGANDIGNWIGLKDLVDNGTTYVNVGHVYRGEEDVCLKMFGEQDEECIKHNEFLIICLIYSG